MTLAVSDAAAMAIASAIKEQTKILSANQLKQTADNVLLIGALEKLFGPQLLPSPGSLTTVAGLTAKNLEVLCNLTQKQNEDIRELQAATSKISKSLGDLTTGVGTISFTMTKSLINDQLSVADQIKKTKFDMDTTKAAQERAGVPVTTVTPAALDESVKEAFTVVNIMEAQARTVAIVTGYVTEASVYGFKTSTEWIAQTEIGKWVTDQFTKGKAAIEAIFAKKKVEEKTLMAQLTITNAKGNPIA